MIRSCRHHHFLTMTSLVTSRSLPSLASSVPLSTSGESARKQMKKHQNELFDDEKKRQSSLIPRIEKIEVKVLGIPKFPEGLTLLMNKGISTPVDCAQHIHEHYSKLPFADVNDILWDMHRPLEENCNLKFRHFEEANPFEPNRGFWRSCSFLLGMVIDRSIKEETGILLHSWPRPDPSSGSFIYDVSMASLEDWYPSKNELSALSNIFWKINAKNLSFERLTIKNSLAQEMFSQNKFKLQQLTSMETSNETVTVYRVGDHIDISIGPMIASTGQIGRVTIASVHKMGSLYRFQGVALPSALKMNHYVYQMLVEKAKKLNPIPALTIK